MGKAKGGGHKKGGGGGKKATQQQTKKAPQQQQQAKCRHLNSAVEPSLFAASSSLDMGACGLCAKDDVDLVVCLQCALVACKTHAKKHWANAKKGHCLFMEEEGTVTCWECDDAKVFVDGNDALMCCFEAVTGGKFVAGKKQQGEKENGSVNTNNNNNNNKKKPLAGANSSGSLQGGGAGGANSMDGEYALRGLNNLGNSCYFNSVVQAMASLFAPLLKHGAPLKGPGKLHRLLMETIYAIRANVAGGAKSFQPRDLFGMIRGVAPQFRGGQQQDAHELFLALIDGLDMEKSEFASFFNVEMTSFVTCHTCTKSYARKEAAFDLSVELPTAPISAASSSNAVAQKKGSDSVDASEEHQGAFESTLPFFVPLSDETSMVSEPELPVFCPWDEDPTSLEMDPPLLILFMDGGKGSLPPKKVRQEGDEKKVDAKFSFVESLGVYDCRDSTIQDTCWKLLTYFTHPELLTGDDRYACDNCKEKCDASKQLVFSRLPKFLPVHLKRFKQMRSGKFIKIGNHVACPPLLDITYCSVPHLKSSPIYSLRGFVVHEGGESLRSGHYIAVLKGTKEGSWFEISDTRVRRISEKEAMAAKAFVVFYERVDDL